MGIAHGSEDDYLYVEFLNAPSATVGSTLDSVLNGDKERIYFYHPYETTENVTAYWNFESEAPQATDPGEYTFTLANGEERVFELPYDYQYEVYEQEKDGWRLISVNGDVEKAKATGALTVEEDEKTETFLNEPLYALTVAKEVTGTGADQDKAFDFEITVPSLEGQTVTAEKTLADETAADVTLAFDGAGKAAFALKHGESITISDLPYDTAYAVTESAPGIYVLSASVTGDTATVDDVPIALADNTLEDAGLRDNTTLTFTNTHPTVAVTGAKTWVDGGQTHDNAEEITLILTRKSAQGRQRGGNRYGHARLGGEHLYLCRPAPVRRGGL